MSYFDSSSTARTRYKRSHRVPARFDDFSELPTEVGNLLKKSPFHPTLKVSQGLWVKRDKKSSEEKASVSPAPASTPDDNLTLSFPSSTSSSTSSPAPPSPPSLNSPPPPPPPPPSNPTPPPAVSSKSSAEKKATTTTTTNTTPSALKGKQLVESKMNTPSTPANTKHISSVDKVNKIKISNKSASVTKTLANNSTPPSDDSGISQKPSSKKRTKGFSLMVKRPATQSGLSQNHSNKNSNNINNNLNVTKKVNQSQATNSPLTIPATTTSSTTNSTPKYYNNLAQCMQYGTRLMLNEPIYLPRNVATIAPITATLQQIADQARRPPFLSKKAEAYLAYQDERKFSYMTSNFTALVKITAYLEVRDLLNLRLVNKSWKAIVDSDAVWNETRINESSVVDWVQFTKWLSKYKTNHLIMKNISFRNYLKLYEGLDIAATQIKKLTLISDSTKMNRFVVEWMCILKQVPNWKEAIRIHWKVKSYILDNGIAMIPFKDRVCNTLSGDWKERLYVYRLYPELLVTKSTEFLVELNIMTDVFTDYKNDTSNQPIIDVEPI